MNRSAEHRLGSMAGCLKLAGAVPGAPFARFRATMREFLLGALSWLLAGTMQAAEPAANFTQTGQGHSFVCTDYAQGKVFIISPAGKLLWEYDGATNCNDIWVLSNGHLLFNTGHGVKEVSREEQVFFDYESSSEIFACQRLTNGNTFIG